MTLFYDVDSNGFIVVVKCMPSEMFRNIFNILVARPMDYTYNDNIKSLFMLPEKNESFSTSHSVMVNARQ